MAIRTNVGAVQTAISGIDETAWQPIEYTCDDEAQVAECDYTAGAGTRRVTRRLVVRRTRLTGTTQQKLWPDWRHHALLTDLTGDVVAVDWFHRQHATVELAIKDLKASAGLEHLPSGVFSANSAWFQIAILAHNMCRWTVRLVGHDTDRLIVARTIRTRPVAVARPARQPRRSTNPAPAVALALGRHVHEDPRCTPRARTRPDLTSDTRPGAPQNRPNATKPEHPKSCFATPRQQHHRHERQQRRHRLPTAAHRSRLGGSRLRPGHAQFTSHFIGLHRSCRAHGAAPTHPLHSKVRVMGTCLGSSSPKHRR